ncbi:hypothetical protein LWI29_006449 [Acer saccharum]|uniref:Uncharacterized protein n=1 Tax=Acer saccharum TaxID=4024 RepID=A0AA39VY00_ACESA|nr:hypothetical protein LWI29_006449 [Acer saccharum]
MDAIAVVSLVIKKLQGLLPADENTTSNDPVFQKQVRGTINSLDSLKQFLKDEDDREASSGHSSMDDQVVAQLLRAVYSADDALNTLILKKELQEQTDIKSEAIRKSKRFMKNLISRKGMGKLNKEIRRLVEIKEKAVTSDTSFSSVGNGGGRHSSSWQDLPARVSDFYLEEETDVDLANELLIQLVPHEFPKLIAVIGEGGSGKTTLARTIYDRVDVKRYFTKRAWIQVPSLVNARQVLGDILQQINEAELVEESTLSEDELMWRIIKLLHGARCLIVLEDVETTQNLETVLNPLCNSSEFDTRLILTTSDANKLPPQTGYLALHLGRLNEEESWKLFLNKVRMNEDEVVNSELISLKEKILKMGGGLPSEIVLLGGLLSTKGRQYDDWYRVIESASNNKGDILALSYQDLPPEIKPCFLYMGIFPKRVEITMRRLIHLWVAEGFVMPLLDPEETNQEDMAGRCFEELVIRNMIQVIRRKSDGSPKTCYMPGVLYDFFSSKAEAVGFFNRQVHPSSNKNPELAAVRRLATYSGIKNLRSSLFTHVHQNLRSYVAFDTRIRCSPSIETGMLLKKIISNRGFGLLNSLDLEGVYKPTLSDDLVGKLLHLKYLGLRSTFIDILPATVGSLPCLETLDMKHTNIKNDVDIVMKAEKLRHVYLCVNSFNKVLLDLSSLTNLHTLWGLNVGSLSELTLLEKLTRLTKLKLTGDFKLFTSKETDECFAKLTNLQSLKLRSIPTSIKDDKFIFLDSLEKRHKLQELYLLGTLQRERLSGYIPPNLRKLTLSMSKLGIDPMPLLGKLPHLNVLRLLSNSISVESLTCVAGGFPKLRLLKLWRPSVQVLTVKKEAMPCLNELEIRDCPDMQPPQGLEHAMKMMKTTMKKMMMENDEDDENDNDEEDDARRKVEDDEDDENDDDEDDEGGEGHGGDEDNEDNSAS